MGLGLPRLVGGAGGLGGEKENLTMTMMVEDLRQRIRELDSKMDILGGRL